MTKWNKIVSELFGSGEPVTFAKLIQANSQESSASSRLEQWHERTKQKYGIEKLEYDNTQITPSIDVVKSESSDSELKRIDYLRNKYKLNGFDYSATTYNGGWTRIDATRPKPQDSGLITATASWRGKAVQLHIEVRQ